MTILSVALGWAAPNLVSKIEYVTMMLPCCASNMMGLQHGGFACVCNTPTPLVAAIVAMLAMQGAATK
eukprot:825867-Pelagomonas_calceolata.AAC.7